MRKGRLYAAGLVIANLLGLGAFSWPFLFPALTHRNEAHTTDFAWVTLALGACLGALLFLQMGRGGMGPKAVALIGVLGALMVALRLPGFVAGFSAMFLPVLIAGNAFGPGFGFVLGAAGTFASALFVGGVGPWLPFQMVAVGWVGMGAGLVPRCASWRVRIGLLALYGVVAGYAFGAVINLYFWPFAAFSGDVGWDPALPAAANAARYLHFYLATSALWGHRQGGRQRRAGAGDGAALACGSGPGGPPHELRGELTRTLGKAKMCRAGIIEEGSSPGGRGPRCGLRKVRTPQGRTLGKVPGGATRGKGNRKQTAVPLGR